ncbi:MAG TPA: DUF2079 domain-containing protein [Anaerolineae bacterium]|nr:DUF2079 domain-containing protein [Anaerolineae bacterium]
MYVLAFFGLQIRLYEGFHMGTRDLVLFDQALHNTLRGDFFQKTYQWESDDIFALPPDSFQQNALRTNSLFSEHLYFIMMVVLPIYALFPGAYTLFFLQALGAGVGGITVFLLARHVLRREGAALAFSLAYLLHPSLQWSTLGYFYFGFHPDNFFPPLFLMALLMMLKGRRHWATALFVLSLTVVETYALAVVAFAACMFVAEKGRRQRVTWAIVVGLAALWLIAATQLIIPRFRGGGPPWYFTAAAGLREVVRQPARFGSEVLGALGRYILYLFAPLLLVPLAGWPIFLAAVPNALVNLSALAIGYHIPSDPRAWHINALLPIVFVSAVHGLPRVVRACEGVTSTLAGFAIRRPNGWIANPTGANRNRLKAPGGRWSEERLWPVVSFALLGAALISNYWLGPLSFGQAVPPARFAYDEARAESIRQAAALIPDEASLSAASFAGSHFTRRRVLHIAPQFWESSDYVLVDLNPRWDGTRDEDMSSLLAGLKASPDHELMYSGNDIYLFRNRFARPPIQHPVEVNLGHRVRLLGYALDTETVKPGESLTLTLYWQATAPMETSYTVFTHIISEEGAIEGQKDGLPVGSTYPTTHWRSGEIVVDPYKIVLGPAVPPGKYTIEVGLYQLESGQRLEVIGSNGQIMDNRVILQEIQVQSDEQ